ncbi:hypothetical protein BDV93DRAFT_458210 [Ceratobasidium sp. AG-I]|nr:hypothetical protein BDV93DRAFT_458210 [Ceratobasidium sp. AG-I]
MRLIFALYSFRQIVSFPPETIRRFSSNVSEMKKLAGRDWEDILQCCIPCFEGLFPEPHSQDVSVLVFTLAQWHAFAKLCMHTESTLHALDAHTTVLGRRLRRFQKSSSTFRTTESDSEFDARRWCRDAAAMELGNAIPAEPMTRLSKVFSLHMYKLHALGDYVAAIKLYGMTDSYSTQNVCFELYKPFNSN